MEQFENNNNIEQQEPELNILDLIKIALANWYWFVISAVLCVSVAFVYLKWAPKIYTRTASVLIKDDKKGFPSRTPSGIWVSRWALEM